MEEKKNEVAQRNTSVLSWWNNEMTNMVSQDYEDCGLVLDEYSKQCAMAAMTNIFQIVKGSDIDIAKIDKSNLREIVGQAASLKLNANAVPRECYFQIRSFKFGNEWKKKVEMGIEGDGNDAILRNFGVNVDTVYPCWKVREDDIYIPPKHRGIELVPPEWEETGISQKIVKVVYPIKLKDGTFQYLIADRESVKVNLFAHIRQGLMNETFGLVKGGKKTRYDATEKELEMIKEKKEIIFDALRKCETVDKMLACPEARPYISAAWLDTPESMIVRKMRNNATSKFPKNYDTMAQRSFLQMDETYQQVQAEIAENANTVDFIPIEEKPAPPTMPKAQAKEKETVKVEGEQELPDFMKVEG